METFIRTDDDRGDENLIDVLLGLRATLGRAALLVENIAQAPAPKPSEDAPEELVLALLGLVALDRLYRERLDAMCVAGVRGAPAPVEACEGTLLR